MDNPADTDDLEAAWRPLSEAELVVAEKWLGWAWSLVLSKLPGLPDQIDSEDVDVNVVILVLCQMTLRVLKNPDGKKQGSVSIDDGSRSWTYDSAVSTGALYITDAEMANLTADVSEHAYSVMPVTTVTV